MPKSVRTPEEVLKVREEILSAAIRLIGEKGFSSLSMRKLAATLKMTAANIYNYYRNKDELYLDIQTRGFEKLYNAFLKELSRDISLSEKVKAIATEYILFGTGHPHWYNIIFSMDTPKYADYQNTPMEPTALKEKQAGLRLITLTAAVLSDSGVSPEEARKTIVRLWISMHGVVSLVNSRVLQEVEENITDLVELVLSDLSEFLPK